MKKYIMALFMAVLFLSGCGEKLPAPKDIVVNLPDDKLIYLYMPREEAEAVLGSPDEESYSHYEYYNYGVSVAYYKDKIATIYIKDENLAQIASGICTTADESLFKKRGLKLKDYGSHFAAYTYNNGSIKALDVETLSDIENIEYGKYVCISNINSEEPFSIVDVYCAFLVYFDE